MKMKLLIAVLLTCGVAGAVQFFNTAGAEVGQFSKVLCSTGVTCTQESGKLKIVSSPTLVAPLTLENAEVIQNTTDDTVQVLSEDNHTTFQITGFEAKDAILNLYADQGDDAADKFSLKATAADVLSINNNGTAMMSFSSAGAVTGPGTGAMSGFLKPLVAATATTITAAQCGSIFYNSGAVEMELPEASAVPGCVLTFVTLNASNFDVDPDAADIILVLTDAAGDKIRNATLGNTVVLMAVSASQWVEISAVGTWSDAN